MKVSEAIDQLKVGDTVWVKGKVLDFDRGGYDHCPLEVSLFYEDEWIHENDEISLTEPQVEKVTVTEEEARMIDAGKEAGMSVYEFLNSVVPLTKAHDDRLAKAYLYGYTVKPKRWVVRQGGSEVWYLQGFRNSLDGDIVKQWCSYEGCIKFTDKAKAEAVATLIEGSVEEV